MSQQVQVPSIMIKSGTKRAPCGCCFMGHVTVLQDGNCDELLSAPCKTEVEALAAAREFAASIKKNVERAIEQAKIEHEKMGGGGSFKSPEIIFEQSVH